MRPGRNDPCHCGSGKKFKKCCGLARPTAKVPSQTAAAGRNDWSLLYTLAGAGRFVELEAAAQQRIASDPLAGIAWKFLSIALWRQLKPALPALRQAAELLPEDGEAQGNLGNAYRGLGRFEEAAQCQRRALTIDPKNAEAHNNLGSALLGLDRTEEAIESYRRAVQLKPDFSLAQSNLGAALHRIGRLDDAESQYGRAIMIAPDSHQALYNLGNVLRDLGRGEEASASYRRALSLKPDFAEAHCALGHVLRGLGRLEESLPCYRRASVMKPDFVEALLGLGDTQSALARYEDAAASYRGALDINPALADAHNNLGNALRELGQLADAEQSYCRALRLDPESAEVQNNLGNVLLDLGQTAEAAACYGRAVELRPDFAKAHSNLGSAWRDLGELEKAQASYLAALAVAPDFAEVHNNLGMVQRLLGRPDQAEASCRKALELNPQLGPAIAFLGDLLGDYGKFAEAEQLFKQAIEAEPQSPQGWAGIAALRKMTAEDSGWMAAVDKILERPMRPRQEVYLRYAAGKYCDDIRDFERAFMNYRRANELGKTYRAQHDQARLEQAMGEIARVFDRDFISAIRENANGSSRPIFVVGMPRSGTTLAEQILASHPAVFGAGELPYWKLASAACGADAVALSDERLRQLADGYLGQLSQLSAAALRTVDKMPGNFMNLGLIHAALPQARFIHMRRNPLDTCLSIYFQHFHTVHSYANDLDDLAHYYRQYSRLMDHWKRTLSAAVFLEVPYEGLVADQEAWSRKMLEFVGLPWDAGCLEFHKTSRTVTTFSKWQVRQKISKSSVERWRNYEKFLAPLMRLQDSVAI